MGAPGCRHRARSNVVEKNSGRYVPKSAVRDATGALLDALASEMVRRAAAEEP